MRTHLIERGDLATVPVAAAVQEAIERATAVAHDAICQELAAFGLAPLDIAIPEYEQVIYEDEVPIFSALERKRREIAGDEARRS